MNSSSQASSSKFIIKRPCAGSQLVSALNTFDNISIEISLSIASSSPFSSSSSSLFIQAPFWWTTGPWDHLPLLAPAVHILLDLENHTLGSTGSLLSSVSLPPYICISVHFYAYSLVSATNYLVFPALFQVTRWTGGRVGPASLGDASCCSVVSWITLYIYIIFWIRYSVNAICNLCFVVLFCACDIYCMFVRPGRGISGLRHYSSHTTELGPGQVVGDVHPQEFGALRTEREWAASSWSHQLSSLFCQHSGPDCWGYTGPPDASPHLWGQNSKIIIMLLEVRDTLSNILCYRCGKLFHIQKL